MSDALLCELVDEMFRAFSLELASRIQSHTDIKCFYDDHLKTRYLPIALIASRLKDKTYLIAKLQRFIGDFVKGNKPANMFSSCNAEVLSSGHMLLICLLSDFFNYCQDSSLASNGLEFIFSFVQYSRMYILMLVTSEMCALEGVDYGDCLERLVNAVARLSPRLFLTAITDTTSQKLLRPCKHEKIINSLMSIDIQNLKFLEGLALVFAQVHGHKLKEAYLSFFHSVFQRIAPYMDAEANLMEWREITEKIIYKRLLAILVKPRYYLYSARLLASLVIVSSVDFFHAHWLGAVELVLTRIRDRMLPTSDFRLVLQLLHVYFYRYPEAWATMESKLEAVNRSVHSICSSVDQNDFILFLVISGLKLTRATVNNAIMPILSNASEYNLGRLASAIHAYVRIVQCMHCRQFTPPFPHATALQHEHSASILDEQFFNEHCQIDLMDMHVLYLKKLGGVFAMLDEQVLWDDSLFQGLPRGYSVPLEALNALAAILENIPTVTPHFSDIRKFIFLLVKYLYFDDQQVNDLAFSALSKITSLELARGSEESARKWEVMFWALAGSVEVSSERQLRARTMIVSLLCSLFSVPGAAWRHLSMTERAGILSEVTTKMVYLQMDPSIALSELKEHVQKYVSSCAFEYTLIVDDWQAVYRDESLHALSVIDAARNFVLKRTFDMLGSIQYESDAPKFYFDILSRYIQFITQYGVCPAKDDAKMKGRRRLSISSSLGLDYLRSSSKIDSITDLLNQCLSHLLSDQLVVRKTIVNGLNSPCPSHLEAIVVALVPFAKTISEDLRNIKYKFSKRNRKSDQLKVDFTSILASIFETSLFNRLDLFTDSLVAQSSSPTIQFLLKCLLETFYFCSEIDIDNSLPSLRLNLVRMVDGWGRAVLDGNREKRIRFQYLPFKLHSEMWSTLHRWYGEDADGQDSVDEIIRSMITLCWGLQSPSPGNRQECIALSQVFHWIDSLHSRGDLEAAQTALGRLLNSNPAIIDRVVDMAYLDSPSSATYVSVLSRSHVYQSPESKFILESIKQQQRIRLI